MWMTREMAGSLFEKDKISPPDSCSGYDTTHETGVARAWFRESTPGSKIGYVDGENSREGVRERRLDGKAREERYVEAAR